MLLNRYKFNKWVNVKGVPPVSGGGGAFPPSRRRRVERVLRTGARLFVGSATAFTLLACVISVHYGVSFPTAASDVFRQAILLTIQGAVAVHDPSESRLAPLGPIDKKVVSLRNPRLEEILAPGTQLVAPGGDRVTALAIDNATIVRSPYTFSYQPFDEPRLRQIREQYQLAGVVKSAPDEFEAMIRVRSWARSLFRRNEAVEMMSNFNALDLLARRREGRTQNPSISDYDPCHLFPLLYAQLMTSLGYQTRIVSVGHSIVEVWSNQFEKWVLMDPEFDHHFEKAGVPLSAVEMLEANFSNGDGIRLVRGMRYPMLENPTMVHLKLPELRAENCIPWFKAALELTDLRNDWLTNHYFHGHPKRSEANSLVYVDPRMKLEGPVAFRNRQRSRTDRKPDMYWTLNQAEVRFRSWKDGVLELEFDTVTPNFLHFKVLLDGKDSRLHESSVFRWDVHEGENTLVVRPVNRFGVVGIESSVSLSVSVNDSFGLSDGNSFDGKPSRDFGAVPDKQ